MLNKAKKVKKVTKLFAIDVGVIVDMNIEITSDGKRADERDNYFKYIHKLIKKLTAQGLAARSVHGNDSK